MTKVKLAGSFFQLSKKQSSSSSSINYSVQGVLNQTGILGQELARAKHGESSCLVCYSRVLPALRDVSALWEHILTSRS